MVMMWNVENTVQICIKKKKKPTISMNEGWN